MSVNPSASTPSGDAASSAKILKSLKARRGQYKSLCTRSATYLQTACIADAVDLELLKTRESDFKGCLSKFYDAQTQIEDILDQDDHEEKVAFETAYYGVLQSFRRLIMGYESRTARTDSAETDAASSRSNRTLAARIQLPKIELPSFSGAYDAWYGFRNSFESMIHNDQSLSNVDRLHYLQSALKGDAYEVIGGLEISEENYGEAWALLKARYDNKRLIVQNHAKAIIDLPTITKENHPPLRQLLNGYLKHTRALRALDADTRDVHIVQLIMEKLDPVSRREWEMSLKNDKLPTANEFVEFLTSRCNMLESVTKPNRTAAATAVKGHTSRVTSHVVTCDDSCRLCRSSHPLTRCDRFLKMQPVERAKTVREHRLCMNCLVSADHRPWVCKAGKCRKCGKRHHTLLHREQPASIVSPPLAAITGEDAQQASEEREARGNQADPLPLQAMCATEHARDTREFWLATAIICVRDRYGKPQPCRALLDPASHAHFISEKTARRLGVEIEAIESSIGGIGQSRSRALGRTVITIQSRYNSFSEDLDCLILQRITDPLPAVSHDRDAFIIPPNLKLADPEFHRTGDIDILIGTDLFWRLLCVGQIYMGRNHPVLQKTQFGWVVGGGMKMRGSTPRSNMCYMAVSTPLDASLTKFWEIESYGSEAKLTPEGRACEQHYATNVRRTKDGRFMVKLHIRDEILETLGDTKSVATKRFYSLERKLRRSPELWNAYSDFIAEYLRLGHMYAVPSDSVDAAPVVAYLPHHAVVKESSTTTKLRVVFDASCRSSTGVSFNDALMVGPTLQQDLFSIVTRFRTWNYAVTADIAKMYRQVMVDHSHRRLQRILWRNNPEEELTAYELSTVTYGTAPASFLAVRTLHELARLEQHSFPVGASTTLSDFYVDDLLSGANTQEEALKIAGETAQLLERGGFQLRKWASNCRTILDGLAASDLSGDALVNLDKQGTVSTLGVQWDPSDDIFCYNIPPPVKRNKITKRAMLGAIARIFDPLGLIGPVVLRAKMLIQRIWQLRIDWDESLPLCMYTEWCQYEEQLQDLVDIRIGRRIVGCTQPARVELHGFCDASEGAYGACVYLRTIDNKGAHSACLIASKSRVAPLKALSLPRLELCGALVLAQLMDRITDSFRLTIDSRLFWTDSTIVLQWIKSPSKRWTTFVANRVGEIQRLTSGEHWRHVCTLENPADLVSRGSTVEQLSRSSLWWNGPPWLAQSSSGWKAQDLVRAEEPPEQRKVCLVASNITDDALFHRYSSADKLLRVVAYCMRFSHNSRRALSQRAFGRLSVAELQEASLLLVRRVQELAFLGDITALKGGHDLPSNSRLKNLNPFLDKGNILRVGGRLRNAKLPFEHKHPAVLPGSHAYTRMLVMREHLRLMHAGSETTLASLRQAYWPLSARNTVRSVLRKCIPCFRSAPRASQQLMGDLPEMRVASSRPFISVGADYAGPFQVREGKRRNAKTSRTFIALFVCLSTKAIHMELASDLSTDAFIGALKRFMSRRGRPTDILSDNGTNFVGADAELRKLHDAFLDGDGHEELRRFLDTERIRWHFIPPRAPHFGGLWEAGVKSAKRHLRRVAGQVSLAFEEMHTLLNQIEAVLNSRPLSPLSNDPNDLCALTPGHFLIGHAITSTVEPSLLDVQENRLSRWQRVEQLRQHFWSRWSREYLHQLQQRSKWTKNRGVQLEKGQLVVIREDNAPPLRWAMGRVEEVHPGPDGIVRAATVKTAIGCYKRPACKLCILPIN